MVVRRGWQREAFFRFVFVLLLLAATGFLLRQTGTVRPVAIKKSLSGFPHVIGSWHLTDTFQSSGDVVKMLGVDDYIQYNYISPKMRQINLYAGYYRAVGVEGAYHSPKNCIPGGGWGIDRVDSIVLNAGIEDNKHSTVSKMLIRRGGDYQVVLYWFQNRGRIIASEYMEKVYLVWDALLKGRRDGTFVRITVAGGNDIVAAEKEARQFAEVAMEELTKYLPGEKL